jgi:outer membrane lipoprotein SlyB
MRTCTVALLGIAPVLLMACATSGPVASPGIESITGTGIVKSVTTIEGGRKTGLGALVSSPFGVVGAMAGGAAGTAVKSADKDAVEVQMDQGQTYTVIQEKSQPQVRSGQRVQLMNGHLSPLD